MLMDVNVIEEFTRKTKINTEILCSNSPKQFQPYYWENK
jgi:hypothetical protein